MHIDRQSDRQAVSPAAGREEGGGQERAGGGGGGGQDIAAQ